VGADFQLISGQVRGCAVPEFGPVQLLVCTGLEFGALVGTGFGPQQRFSRAEGYGAVVVGPALRLPLARSLFAWLELDASIAFMRPEFRTRGLPGLLYQPRVLGSRALVGLEWQF